MTHQALLRAETTDENSKMWLRKRLESRRVLKHRLIYDIFKVKAMVLTVSFDYTVAVVANISKQLSVTQVKNIVSNTQQWRCEGLIKHGILKQTCKQAKGCYLKHGARWSQNPLNLDFTHFK